MVNIRQYQYLHFFTDPRINQRSLVPLNNAVDSGYFDYFVNICTKEFTLYFESPVWESIVIQAAYTEPCILHTALALGAMSRYEYHPRAQSRQSSELMLEYSMMQYNIALRTLNEALDGSMRSLELAILGSIVFIAFEVLWGADMRVKMHMNGALSILNILTKVDLWHTRTYSQFLVGALKQLNEQLSLFGGPTATIEAENNIGGV